MDKATIIQRAIKAHPGALQYLSGAARLAIKAAPISRDDLERKLARLILGIDRAYLRTLEDAGPLNILPGFWQQYESDLRREIAAPLRQYIEQSFTSYSDYVNFIDQTGALTDIDTAMTRAIDEVAAGISRNTQSQLNALIQQGIDADEIVERIAVRFGSGHAEQVAITELTRAEAQFAEALQMRLGEQGVNTVIRWLTAEDEKVCPLCAPADGKTKDQPINTVRGGWNGQTWGQRYGQPPAHPNCRCQTVVEFAK